MAQKASNRTTGVMADPKKIRAAMARTRATLGRELGALKGRVLGAPADKGDKTMWHSKTKKPTRAKKATRGRAAAKSKTKEVLEHLLTGAALGAVKGVAEVLAPRENGADPRKQRQ